MRNADGRHGTAGADLAFATRLAFFSNSTGRRLLKITPVGLVAVFNSGNSGIRSPRNSQKAISAASIPEGCQPLAGGQSSATTGKESISPVIPHPGMPAGFWHPCGMRHAARHRSGGIAALNHRLMAGNPLGSMGILPIAIWSPRFLCDRLLQRLAAVKIGLGTVL